MVSNKGSCFGDPGQNLLIFGRPLGAGLFPGVAWIGQMMPLLNILGEMLFPGTLACGLRSGFQMPGRLF